MKIQNQILLIAVIFIILAVSMLTIAEYGICNHWWIVPDWVTQLKFCQVETQSETINAQTYEPCGGLSFSMNNQSAVMVVMRYNDFISNVNFSYMMYDRHYQVQNDTIQSCTKIDNNSDYECRPKMIDYEETWFMVSNLNGLGTNHMPIYVNDSKFTTYSTFPDECSVVMSINNNGYDTSEEAMRMPSCALIMRLDCPYFG